MRTVQTLLDGINFQVLQGDIDMKVSGIAFDSREVSQDILFVAIAGTHVDGHQFLPQVLEKGCRTVIVEKDVNLASEVTVIKVENSAQTLGRLACNFYDHPSKKLKLTGITGTNGKTTSTTLLFDLFTTMGHTCGLLSTVENRIGSRVIPSTHTTPNPLALNQLLAQMVEEGVEYAFMEVSSHAVHQHRIEGLEFAGAGFTNITHDHLDYHKTFGEYIRVKKSFFDGLSKSAFAVVNGDDKNGKVMLQNTKARTLCYALQSPADYKGKIIENSFMGLVMQFDGTEVVTPLVGTFNAYNLMLVYAIALELGKDKMEVLQTISALRPVQGRFQYFKSESGIIAIVDYAHTPDALENVLKTISGARSKEQKIITVVGCGGDRDAAKRPIMAKIAAEGSQQVVLTSDNPRTEDPMAILAQMEEGIPTEKQGAVLTISDRKQAIKTAVSLAKSGDILLIAGKGHEKYQEINGVKHDFDDVQITKEIMNQLKK